MFEGMPRFEYEPEQLENRSELQSKDLIHFDGCDDFSYEDALFIQSSIDELRRQHATRVGRVYLHEGSRVNDRYNVEETVKAQERAMLTLDVLEVLGFDLIDQQHGDCMARIRNQEFERIPLIVKGYVNSQI